MFFIEQLRGVKSILNLLFVSTKPWNLMDLLFGLCVSLHLKKTSIWFTPDHPRPRGGMDGMSGNRLMQSLLQHAY